MINIAYLKEEELNEQITKLMQLQFDKMCATGKLFRSSLSGQEVWNLYINGFETKYNPIFRDPQSSTHNCNLCNNFIRRYWNGVSIDAFNALAKKYYGTWDYENLMKYYDEEILISFGFKKL